MGWFRTALTAARFLIGLVSRQQHLAGKICLNGERYSKAMIFLEGLPFREHDLLMSTSSR